MMWFWNDQLMRDTLKTKRTHEIWFQKQIYSGKSTNIWLSGNNEKSEDKTNGIKILLPIIVAENILSEGKEYNIEMKEAYMTWIVTKKKESLCHTS